MKEKRGIVVLWVCVLLFVFASFQLVLAQETAIDKAYTCLEGQLGDNCGNTANTKQAAFNLLATAYDSSIKSDCTSSLSSKKKDSCWGETATSSCNIKPTAIATLSLLSIREDAQDSIDWLLDNKKSATNLEWFLEIDSNNETQCDINGQTITVLGNKQLSGSNPAGLSKAYDNYWYRVNDLDKNYSISCDKDFITAFIYRKPGDSLYYVSSKTNSASAFDTIIEKVESFCFTTSGVCDYEGSLWATLALSRAGKNIDSYVPYLATTADEAASKKYFPSAFLYMLMSGDDYYAQVTNKQKQNKYWQESSDRLYDTALGLLSLQGISVPAVENAKDYLLSVQEDSGCWDSNTAFILHAGWPKEPQFSGGGGSVTHCESFGNFCVSGAECTLTNTLPDFYCPALSDVCCTTAPVQLTCAEKKGIVCRSGETCTGSEVISADENFCCLASCVVQEKVNECESAGYFCKDSCFDSQEEKITYSNSCSTGQVCCGDKPEEEGINIWIIVLLIVLIILVILAIIFRKKLKVFLFRRKSGLRSGKGPAPTTRPGPPGFPQRRIFPRPVQRRPTPRTTPAGRPARSSREFDDTMKQLREMSK